MSPNQRRKPSRPEQSCPSGGLGVSRFNRRLHELAFVLPPGAHLLDEKTYIAADDAALLLHETGVRLSGGART